MPYPTWEAHTAGHNGWNFFYAARYQPHVSPLARPGEQGCSFHIGMTSGRLSFSGEIVCEALSAATFSHIIGAIYDCAIDPSRWPSTFGSLREVLGFRTAALAVNALPSGQALIVATDGITPEWLAAMPQYSDDVIEQWGGAEAVRAYDPDVPHVLSWVRDRSLWENNRYYVEWSRPQGLIDVMAVVAARDLSAIGTFG